VIVLTTTMAVLLAAGTGSAAKAAPVTWVRSSVGTAATPQLVTVVQCPGRQLSRFPRYFKSPAGRRGGRRALLRAIADAGSWTARRGRHRLSLSA